jgi:hypothetical protein
MLKHTQSLSAFSSNSPRLDILGCEFKNIYFNMNRIFSLADLGGHVAISDSKFHDFSTCGSIIGNSKPVLRTPTQCETAYSSI